MFYALFVCGHYLVQYRFIQVCIFYLFPYITVFFVFLRFLCFLPVLNSTYSHLIYIATIRYFFLFLSITSHLNNLWEQIHVIKTWLQLLIKSMLPGSFWVLKILFIRKIWNIYKMRHCKRNLIGKYFLFLRKFNN